jgi:hypothetical protein
MPAFDLIRVVEAKALGAGTLWLRFSDGHTGTVDLSADVPDRFDELRDSDYFARLHLAGGGVEWPNGFDCAPEWLRERAAAGRTAQRQNGDDWSALQRHAADVPEISRFFGIIIRMFYSDHARPHFHAEYGEYAISVEIDGDGVHGSFPPSRLPMLFDWRDQHRAELMENWDRLRRGEHPAAIPPLL